MLIRQKWWSSFVKFFHSCQHERYVFDKRPHPNPSSVNRHMLDCLNGRRPFQALIIFKKQLEPGFFGNADEVSVALALKACVGNLKLGRQIHWFSLSSGLVSYITVSNSLMNMYCKSGEFERAFAIFEKLNDPDIVSWNTVLSGFRSGDEALAFALKMNSNGVVFDTVTYTTILSFCSNQEEFCFGFQLHSPIFKFGFGSEIFVANALITMYSRWDHLLEARKVFDEMPKRDTVSWGAMLSGYTQEGDHGFEAIMAFIEMVRQGMKLDHVSFSSAVSACGHEKNLGFGRQVHCLATKTGYGSHISVCNVLMSTYNKCDAVEDAKRVFEIMNERNVISWTTILSLDKEDSVSIFNEMRLDGVYPNDVTFIGFINAVSTRKLVEVGQSIHGLCTKAGFLSELTVSNSLITMYGKFDSMDDSLKVFEELHFRQIITWNALISGYAQNFMYQEALETFYLAIHESKPNQYTYGSVLSAIGAGEDISIKHGQRCHCHLIQQGLNSDPVVFSALLDMYAKRGNIAESQRIFGEMSKRSQFAWTAIISGHARHGNFDSVMNLFREMESQGEKPDSITFLSVLTACGRKGMVDIGRQIFNSMINDHMIDPSPEHYSCMVDMLGRAGKLEEAEEMLERIPEGPGLSVLQSLLGNCRIHGNVEMAERVVDALLEMEPSESGSYVLMSNLYAQRGDWEKVAKMRKGMRERGVRKEVGFSWVDVGNAGDCLYMHGFSSGDSTHPRAEEISRMTEYLGLEMKFLRERQRGDVERERESPFDFLST